MVKPIVLVILLLLCQSMQAQHFKFSVDTIMVDTTNMTCDGKFSFRLSFIAKRKGNLYCLYKNQQMGKVGKCAYNHLLMIDRDGLIKQVPLPVDIRDGINVGEGLFVRNDSVILRRHRSYSTSIFTVQWEKEHGYGDDEIGMSDYYLDVRSSRWVEIPFADDHVYEDKQYKVLVWAHGEWGTYTRFLSKKTGKDYIYRCTPTRVYKQKDGYYLIGVDSIMRICDPTEGQIYQEEEYFDVDHKHLYTRPAALINASNHIYTSFMLKKQLYFIMESALGICIATYRDGTISKVMDIDCNYTPYVYQSYMHDCDSPKEHTLLLLTDRKAGKDAILTVEGTNIYLRYITYK